MDKVPQKRAPAKAKVVKATQKNTEVVLPVKKATIKKPATAVATKPATKVKSKTQITKKKLPVKKVASQTKNNSDEVKLVPGSISLRLAEKRKLYERVYQDYVPRVMRPVAITGGYAYVTIGIFLAIFMANPVLSNLVSQTASVLCFTGDCQTATSTVTEQARVNMPIEFMPLAPIVPGSDTNLQLALNLDVPVRIALLPVSGGDSLVLAGVSESASNIVNFLLPTATLSNGSYLVQAELYDEETKQVRVKSLGPTFVVENPTKEIDTLISDEDLIPDLLIEEPIEEGEVLGVSTTSLEALTETDEQLVDEEEEEVVARVQEDMDTVEVVANGSSDIFDLTVVPGTTSTQSILKIIPTYVFDRVELVVKLKGDGESFFIGQATKANENWFYWLDNTSIPTGDYALIVRGFDDGELSEEAVFNFSVRTRLEPSDLSVLQEIETRVNLLLKDSLDIDELAEQRASYATSYLESSAVQYPDDILADYLPKLDQLFASYASVIAGGNSTLAIIVDNQIEKYLDTIIVESSDNNDADENIAYELSALIVSVKEHIKAKEADVIKLSGGDSAFDIDMDGLTDYDEVVIYGTDPKLADTDNDGYLDSIEIVLGYDPLDAKIEAVSRINSSAHADLINGELLAVSAVEPFYFYTEADSSPKILTSVSGKGVPNSFARLYLGDSSESVIVKVGPAGTFTQTIDKDFVKIEGEVVLAVTDNSGKIVMRGQPLQVEKVVTSRQLFNPANIDAAVIKSVEEFKTSNIIGALGVVSFGLILLLLGKALVPRREPVSLEIA